MAVRVLEANAPALAFGARDSELRSRISQGKTSLSTGGRGYSSGSHPEVRKASLLSASGYNHPYSCRTLRSRGLCHEPIGNFVELFAGSCVRSPRAVAHLTISHRAAARQRSGGTGRSAQVCQNNAPFFGRAGEVATFLPGTPTVFVGVGQGPIGWAPCIRL